MLISLKSTTKTLIPTIFKTPITSEDQEADEVERNESTIENKEPDWQLSNTSAKTEFPGTPQPLSLLHTMTGTDYSYNRNHRESGGISQWALASPSSSFFGENEDHETPQAHSSLSIGDPWDDYHPSVLVPRLPALDNCSSELTTPSSFGIRTPGMNQDIYISDVFSSDTGTGPAAGVRIQAFFLFSGFDLFHEVRISSLYRFLYLFNND